MKKDTESIEEKNEANAKKTTKARGTGADAPEKI